MPTGWLGEDVQTTMTDRYHQSVAPIVMWGAVRALSGGVEPTTFLVEMSTTTSETEWRVAWVTEQAIGFVSASKDRQGWTAYSHDYPTPDSITSWVRPLSDVRGISLTKVDCNKARDREADEDVWFWSSAAVVTFLDGSELPVPLFAISRDNAHDQAVHRFLEVVAGAIGRPGSRT